MSPLRIAVVGAGHMGSLHAAKLTAFSREEPVRLIGVADPLLERARAAAGAAGARAVADHRELLGEIDAAIVAVPTVHHFELVGELLAAGVDVLVEKPIAASLPEAHKLVDAARDQGRVLQVGHLERFNAAMQTVSSLVRDPRFFEAHRLGPFPGRATDVDVVRDLMIHDLDLVQRLVGEEPSTIDAIGVPVLTDEVDIANARVHFPGGAVANFTASRVSVHAVRKIRFFQPDGYFSLDFLEQNVTIARRVPEPDGSRRVAVRQLEIDRSDALLAQLRAFCQSLRTRESPDDTAGPALAALRTALRVVEAIPPLRIPDDDDLPRGG